MQNAKPARKWTDIPGFFTAEDGIVLQWFVRSLKFPLDHVIVEIGSFLGRSTVCMASVSRHKVVAIDPHRGLIQKVLRKKMKLHQAKPTWNAFRNHLEQTRVSAKVEVIRKQAENVEWNGRPIALLFIDGLHDEEHVSQDFWNFSPYVVKGGFCVFHDYGSNFYPDIAQFVDEVALKDGYEMVDTTRMMAITRRTK